MYYVRMYTFLTWPACFRCLDPGPDPDPAGGLKYYQGLHEIQSCTRTADFFFFVVLLS